MRIVYARSDTVLPDFKYLIERAITENGLRRVCDLGAGANPILEPDFIERNQLEYTIMDISREELAKAPAQYTKIQTDLASPLFEPSEQYDLAVSVFLAEHVRDPEAFHSNVWRLLAPGGKALHLFSTLYSLPFVANKLVPARLSQRLVRIACGPVRENDGNYGTFPAYYRWCRGPTRKQILRLQAIGYQIEEYAGLFGHAYFGRIPALQRAELSVASWLTRHPIPHLTSYAWVILTKTCPSGERSARSDGGRSALAGTTPR